jgi:ferredoxin-NADP reductase
VTRRKRAREGGDGAEPLGAETIAAVEPLDADAETHAAIEPLGAHAETQPGTERMGASAEAQAAVALTPSSMSPMPLIERQRLSTDQMLLTFSASVTSEPRSPWHVKLALPATEGEANLIRAYTVLRCADGKLELLIKIHPHGRCSQALARLPLGQTVNVRGPIATDEVLHQRLFAAPTAAPSDPAAVPPALHCLSAGSGLSPMLQMTEALVRGREQTADASTPPCAAIRIWSFNRTSGGELLAPRLASVQRRALTVGITVQITHVLTREPEREPGLEAADPCQPFGGCSTTLRGRPELRQIIEHVGVALSERHAATLVICGPDAFNVAMESAARQLGYAPDGVFVRS